MKFLKFLKIGFFVCVILLAAWVQVTIYLMFLLFLGFKAGLWPNLD